MRRPQKHRQLVGRWPGRRRRTHIQPMNPHHERLAAALADRYRLERPLGQGGMATVLLAEDLKHRRKRSEEHTSELQSRPHLVCRLLLEKKKKKMQTGQILSTCTRQKR